MPYLIETPMKSVRISFSVQARLAEKDGPKDYRQHWEQALWQLVYCRHRKKCLIGMASAGMAIPNGSSNRHVPSETPVAFSTTDHSGLLSIIIVSVPFEDRANAQAKPDAPVPTISTFFGLLSVLFKKLHKHNMD